MTEPTVSDVQQALIVLHKWSNCYLCPDWGKSLVNNALAMIEIIFQKRERLELIDE